MTYQRPLPRPKCKSLMGVRVAGTGKYLPEIVVTNADLYDKLNFAARGYNAEWIEQRTGINRKRQVNLFDPDGTRIELMESATIDGKPTPSSPAPPPH